ncbi:MAG: class I SAM-dependent methyltransferase [Desulfobacterales bacterium]|nr:class I SAM-dependent methyltransferase [Desulfobacterales bacterium]
MRLSLFKAGVQKHFDAIAPSRRTWKQKNRYYHASQEKYLRFLIPPGKKVLDLGCGTGELLNAVEPAYGVGIDISSAMIQQAADAFPHLHFIHADGENARAWDIAERFDFIIISDTLGLLEDIQATLQGLHPFCDASTRVIIGYYNFMWEPVLKLAEMLGRKTPQPEQN